MSDPVHIVGGGLAGSEAAWQLAERGHDVVVHEMRPIRPTPAHKTDRLAELVCSNTFKSTETTNAHGLLKAEMRLLGSVILEGADEARVPGGSALTVDRAVFSSAVHARVTSHPRITVVREEMTTLPSPGIIATGPLPPNPAELIHSESFSRLLTELAGRFDKIIIDSPPILPVADATILSTKVDGTVLVARAFHTSKDAMRRALRRHATTGGAG